MTLKDLGAQYTLAPLPIILQSQIFSPLLCFTSLSETSFPPFLKCLLLIHALPQEALPKNHRLT